jgi:hypothetical protein
VEFDPLQNADRIASEIERILPNAHSGTLQFWGTWFGRPHDNFHIIQTARSDGDRLDLEFDGGERLQIWQPRSWKVSAKEFSIFNASKVRWEWFYYGRPATAGNLMFYNFDFNAGDIIFSSNFPIQSAQKPNPHAPAVMIH